MTEGGKGRRTRSRSEVKVERAVRGNFLREWLNDRWAAAEKRNAAARRRRPSGTGVTAQMKAISQDAARRDPEYVVQHSLPNREMRRSGLVRDSGARNVPYVVPVRAS